MGEIKTSYLVGRSAQLIDEMCDKVKAMLLEKNEMYGDSALSPIRIFSKASSLEQIKVRIDDKLSRLSRGVGLDNEDTLMDLTGYLVLLLIARRGLSDDEA